MKITNIINRFRYVFYRKFKPNMAVFGHLCKGSKITIERGGVFNVANGFYSGVYARINIRSKAELRMGQNFSANGNLFLACRNKITIGDNVNIGPNVCIVDNDHDYTSPNRKTTYKLGEIYIGDNVWIGANAVILRGAKIGDNCVIGAGSIVKGNIPSNYIYYTKGEGVLREIPLD